MKRVNVHPKLVLLQLVLAAFFLSVTASASPQIILNENGWSDTSVGDWVLATMTGTLTANVNVQIQITSDGITLDGGGFSLDYIPEMSGPRVEGVLLSDQTGVTIKNMKINGFLHGIMLTNCTDITMEGNTISEVSNGIYLHSNSSNNTVNNNYIFNSSHGIALSNNSSDNTITRNTFSSNNYGFHISTNCEGNDFKYNHVSGNLVHFYISESQNNLICNNNFVAHQVRPVDNSISGNTFFLPETYGNHWDNFTTPDDYPPYGIVDSAYKFNLGQDDFPFVKQYDWNHAPMVDAGEDGPILNAIVYLDGSRTWDPENDPMTFQWTFDQKPVGSNAVLEGSTTLYPTFTVDVNGEYVIRLTATDFFGESASSTVTRNFSNAQPVADAGVNQNAFPGDVVALDGSGSSDANQNPLTYAWSFVTMPEGSTATFADHTAIQTSFTPDLVGTYEISLVVNDGFVDSDPALVTIEVVSPAPDMAVLKLMEAVEAINLLDSSDFKRTWQQTRLTRKVNQTIRLIENGFYQWAYLKLRFDIIRKIDGWNERGVIDRNDWISTPFGQTMVYPSVKEALDLLENIL